MSFTVEKPGLETSVQDWPGRHGYYIQGFPPSGPMDAWSFRLANLLVGNAPGVAALECQFLGPRLRFAAAAVVALCGADMGARLDGEALPLWESVAVAAGQTLAMGAAKSGARCYLAVGGGIDVEPVLGSRSTFAKAGVGGFAGGPLRKGQTVAVGKGPVGTGALGVAGRRVREAARPEIAAAHAGASWEIGVVRGPDDDWIDAAGQARFLASAWTVSSRSDRTGQRLEGPDWTFTEKATQKRPEHGSDPSNILDHGYPIGAVNLAGQTPIILCVDGPSTGGFINPYTVPSAEFWKLGQARPGQRYRFREISLEEAQARRRAIDALCVEASVEGE